MMHSTHFIYGYVASVCERKVDVVVFHILTWLSGFDVNGRKEGRKEVFYLTTHSTHFIYGYMASDIW